MFFLGQLSTVYIYVFLLVMYLSGAFTFYINFVNSESIDIKYSLSASKNLDQFDNPPVEITVSSFDKSVKNPEPDKFFEKKIGGRTLRQKLAVYYPVYSSPLDKPVIYYSVTSRPPPRCLNII